MQKRGTVLERYELFRLDKVLAYTKQNLVLYLSETDLNRLCGYITEYYLSDSLPKVEQIKVDAQLKTIDSMHFGWNIGKAFDKPRLQTATFIPNRSLEKASCHFLMTAIRKTALYMLDS